jgi:hypothetical protein
MAVVLVLGLKATIINIPYMYWYIGLKRKKQSSLEVLEKSFNFWLYR